MVWQFDEIEDLKIYAKHLAEILDTIGEKRLSYEVAYFKYNSFTTSSEYLGEFRILLSQLLLEDINLKKNDIDNIEKAIKEIDKAFRQ